MQIPADRDTKTAKDLGDETVEAAYDGTTGTDLPPGSDKFTVTRAEQKEYGIKTDETYRWVQKPEVWARGTGTDRVREIRRLGGRLIEDPKLKGPVDLQDLVLVAVPKALEEARLKQEEEDFKAYQERVDSEGKGYDGQFDPEDKKALRQRVANQRALHAQSNLIGPTRGNPLHWYKTYTDAQREEEAGRLRRGNRHHASTDEVREATADAARMGRKGQKSFSAPDMPRDAQGRLLRAK